MDEQVQNLFRCVDFDLFKTGDADAKRRVLPELQVVFLSGLY